jgi:flavin-dependent dehydrogenase
MPAGADAHPHPLGPFDVAIAGAGPAGAAQALLLARRGVHVALLDAASFPRDKLCGEYLSPESWSVLDRLGLASVIAGMGYQPIRLVRITTPRGREVTAEVAGPDGLPGIGLGRSVLDTLIVDRARAAGAEVFERVRVRGPIVADGRVVGLSARHPKLGALEVHARVTVAASGRHSPLVRQTGSTQVRNRFRTRHFGLKQHLVVSEADASEPLDAVGLHLVPGAYGGTCRIDGNLTNFCALLPESALRRHRGDLARVVRQVLGTNPALARVVAAGHGAGGWKTVAGVRVEFSAPRLPGIFYAGDCQGTVDPLGGQGMTMALVGAEILAPYIERALVADADAVWGMQHAALAAWHRRFDRRIRLCRLLHHLLVNPILIDAAASLGAVAPRLLSACYRQTRDRETALG